MLKYVCVCGVFFVCIVGCGAVDARIWEVGVFRHVDVVYLCLVCILCQFSILHDLQFVNVGRGCKRRPYGRGVPQTGLMTAL